MNGIFVTFEGIEGSGKSTQVRLLVAAFQQMNLPYLTTREPGGTNISEAIRSILLNPSFPEMKPETELLLYCASRAQHTGELILPALQEGKIVICDRYFDSTYAYQGAARDLDENLIDTLTVFATYGRVPDITFLIDLPVSVGLSRIQDRQLDRLEQENSSFHERVRNQFLSIANKCPSRYYVLDGSDEPEAIHQKIISALQPLIGERND
ncbi:MAG: dTMP kinase [Candidatus Cloacimonetes bacterium HGW-Cloacimonetes-3]|jgi:dTMP kinase|nr:MAG: dTMP kinase [Candidatus Cloacimonetes bacterium HGW-Cloacimonetes-3]